MTAETTPVEQLSADAVQANLHWQSNPYSPEPFFPKRRPRSAAFVAAVEFSPAPAHAEDHVYYLSTNRQRTLWFLWLHVYSEWDEEAHEDVWAYGTCPKTAPKEVAVQLLQTAWQGQYGGGDRPWFRVTDVGLLSKAEIAAIGNMVWPKR